MRRLRALSFRLYGEPPSRDATRLERLRYVRRFYTRSIPLTLLLLATVALFDLSRSALIVVGAVVLVQLLGLVTLLLQIRDAERRERAH